MRAYGTGQKSNTLIDTPTNTHQHWMVWMHPLANLLRIVQVWRNEDLSNNELQKISQSSNSQLNGFSHDCNEGQEHQLWFEPLLESGLYASRWQHCQPWVLYLLRSILGYWLPDGSHEFLVAMEMIHQSYQREHPQGFIQNAKSKWVSE